MPLDRGKLSSNRVQWTVSPSANAPAQATAAVRRAGQEGGLAQVEGPVASREDRQGASLASDCQPKSNRSCVGDYPLLVR